MRIALAAVSVALLAACTGKTPPPAVEVRTVEKLVDVQRPCAVTVPQRPAPLPTPLPTDATKLAATLGAKLTEYSGPGRFADKALAALQTCTKVTP